MLLFYQVSFNVHRWRNSFVSILIPTEKMTPSNTAKFYTRISGIMSMYKRYPAREGYDRVAREIVKKYPFLKNPISGHVSFMTWLTDYSIYTCFSFYYAPVTHNHSPA